MKRGRGKPPMSNELRVLSGGKKHRMREEVPAEPLKAAPNAPETLTPDAKDLWDELAPKLIGLGLLTDMDMGTLEGYCAAWVTYKQAQAAIDEHGLVYSTPTGNLRPRPEVNIAHKYLQLLRGYMNELGLSPAARAHMSKVLPAAQKETLNELEALLD